MEARAYETFADRRLRVHRLRRGAPSAAPTDHVVINVDKMTYAASRGSAGGGVGATTAILLIRADIADAAAMRQVFATHDPDAVMHLAAESHVDRSIDGPGGFIQTNVVGTFMLLEAARRH